MNSPADSTTASEPAGQASSTLDADALTEVLCRHKDQLGEVFKRQPIILAHALRSLDDDDDVLHKFLCKHSHVVGKFLEKQKDIGAVAEFLAKYPKATYKVLDDEPAIIENFLVQNPEALQVYLDTEAGNEAVVKHLERKPERLRNIMANNSRQEDSSDNTSSTSDTDHIGANDQDEDSDNEDHGDEDSSDDDDDDKDFTPPALKTMTSTNVQAVPKPAQIQRARPSSQLVEGATPWNPLPYPGNSTSNLIPYPAPPKALASDAAIIRHRREWSLRDEDTAIKHMLAIRDEGKVTGETRFKKAVERVNKELGTKRTWVSFKNFWNRIGRARSGFDERRRKTATLATSKQLYGTKKQKAAALAKRKQAQASQKNFNNASGSESDDAVTVSQQHHRSRSHTRVKQPTSTTGIINRNRHSTGSPEPFFVQWLRPRRVTIVGQLWLIPRYPGPDGTNIELPAVRDEEYDDNDYQNGEVEPRGVKRKRDDSDDEKED